MGVLIESIQEVFGYIVDPTLVSPGFGVFWQTTRIIFVTVSLFLLGLIIFLLSINDYFEWRFAENYTELHKLKPRFKVNIKKQWEEVINHSKSEDDSERRLAIIDADDIFNDVLSKIGYIGDNTYDKLARLNKDIIPNIEELKKAYKIKKEIMHDPNRILEKEETEEIVSQYEKFLTDIQVI
jgi:hypothetical protein